MDADAHVALVRAAADAHFNTLRLWGRGIFMPQLFYEAADQMGLLIYHVRTTMRQQQARLTRGNCETLMTRRHSPYWEAVV